MKLTRCFDRFKEAVIPDLGFYRKKHSSKGYVRLCSDQAGKRRIGKAQEVNQRKWQDENYPRFEAWREEMAARKVLVTPMSKEGVGK